jgi:biopolymer transport protein ExbD
VLDAPAARAAAAAVIDVASTPGGEVTILVDGEKVEQPKLRDTLQTRRDATPDAPSAFSLRADDAVPYGVVEHVLIDLAVSRYVGGQIETRAGGSHSFSMPVRSQVKAPGRPAPVEVRLAIPGGEPTVEVRDTSVSDLGQPLVRLLTETRAGVAADAVAVVWPDADVPYSTVARAYAACQAAGFEHVVFHTSGR